MKTILTQQQMALTIRRLAHQLIEDGGDLSNLAIIGIQPRGTLLANRLVQLVDAELPGNKLQHGKLDITFYRDDIRSELHVPTQTDIPFSVEGKRVVLVDDVLYTGRTTRAAMDALLDFGRPSKVQLAVLVERRFSRELPIQPDFRGCSIDSLVSQKVKVCWKEDGTADEVVLVG